MICATFTLGLGLAVWVDTLQTRAHLGELWEREAPLIQSLLQQKVRDSLQHLNAKHFGMSKSGTSAVPQLLFHSMGSRAGAIPKAVLT